MLGTSELFAGMVNVKFQNSKSLVKVSTGTKLDRDIINLLDNIASSAHQTTERYFRHWNNGAANNLNLQAIDVF